MIHKYDKDGEFHREIEVAWDKHDKCYEITKRNVSGKNSQGHTMQFGRNELRKLSDMINKTLRTMPE